MKSNKTKESSMTAGIQPSIPEEIEEHYRLIKGKPVRNVFSALLPYIKIAKWCTIMQKMQKCKNTHPKVMLHNTNINITHIQHIFIMNKSYYLSDPNC